MTERAVPPTVTLRPFDPPTDSAPIAELITATNIADNLDWLMTVETLRLEVRPGGWFDPERDTRVAELDGVLAGFIRVSARARGPQKVVHRMDVWTRPELRRHGVGRAMLAWSHERARAIRDTGTVGPPGAIHELASTADAALPAAAAFAEACGYRLVRYSFEMRRRLDLAIPEVPLPPGLEMRPVGAADHRRIWDANVEAFRDHWEPAERTEQDFHDAFASPDLDTALWQVAWAGDHVAGVSMNTIYRDENERLGIRLGWLDQVSVRRPWRRQGVGAALIAGSLRVLRERGMDEASLGVDAENPTGALALYERLGFTRNRTFQVFRKAV